ncbi:MAG: putative sugar diacid utilization regulator [Mycobacterium sp.]|nr:putative sugar diacid utilization regulator [Mycobacterium sp.]
MLSSELAQQIASDITDVIGHNVLITDANGIVLGSGDRSRVGQFHEASIGVARTKMTRSHSAADVAALEGSLPGVTLPLVHDDEIVGTVGLSGPPGLVGQFGLIVKRQTEILMSEANRIGIRATRQRAADDLLRDIFDLHRSEIDPQTVTRRATSLGQPLDLPRQMVVIRVREPSGRQSPVHAESDLTAEIIDIVRDCFPDPGDLSARLSRSVIAVMTSPRTTADQLRRSAAALAERAASRQCAVSIGIGPPASGVTPLNRSAQDARDALDLGDLVDPGVPVHDIEDLRLPQVLRTVPEPIGQRFSAAILGEIRHAYDWPELRLTLMAWGDAGFNAKRAAERLHVHRNTLLYRLQKIEKVTGRPIGPAGAAMVLYLAAVLDELQP